MTRYCQNAYEPKWKELCELFDEDENLDIPVPDEEEEDDDADLLLEIPNMAAPPTQHDELATIIFYPICIYASSSSDDEDGTDLNDPKVLKDDGASSSNAALPDEPPSKGK
ncbi:UNVERIFIED_CONTAM: hypothetical protein Sindi_1436300 [Sesamum indicum]